MDINQMTKSEAFKRGDATSYDAVAKDFERLAQRFARPIATRMLDLAQIGRGSRVLDVGCGTGIVARFAATRLGGAGRLTGVDLSEGAIQKARELASEEGLDGSVAFDTGDAEHLAFADQSFDVVVSLYAFIDVCVAVPLVTEVLKDDAARRSIGALAYHHYRASGDGPQPFIEVSSKAETADSGKLFDTSRRLISRSSPRRRFGHHERGVATFARQRLQLGRSTERAAPVLRMCEPHDVVVMPGDNDVLTVCGNGMTVRWRIRKVATRLERAFPPSVSRPSRLAARWAE